MEGIAFVTNNSLISDNSAQSGNSFYLQGGMIIGVLPLPAGHWLPASTCGVVRKPCSPMANYDGVGPSPCNGMAPNSVPIHAETCACFDVSSRKKADCTWTC